MPCADFLGFVATIYPTDADEAKNRVFPYYGFLLATGGIILSFVPERVAPRLEAPKPVRRVLEWLMIPGIVLGIGGVVSLFCSEPAGHPSPLCSASWRAWRRWPP